MLYALSQSHTYQAPIIFSPLTTLNVVHPLSGWRGYCGGQSAGFALLFEAIAGAFDIQYVAVVEQAVEHGGGSNLGKKTGSPTE